LIEDLSDRADGVAEAAKAGDKRGGKGEDKPAGRDDCVEEGACSPFPVLPAPSSLPEPWTREGAVLCVSGRGFLDTAAAAILAQILAKRGVGTRVVSFADTASARLATLEPGQARLACVVTIAHGGEPGHLARLLTRLRSRMPSVPILAGVWLAEERQPAFTLEVDHRADSLREAVEAVLELAEAEGEAAPRAAAAPPSAPVVPAVVGQSA
jgi:hypothetical protein